MSAPADLDLSQPSYRGAYHHARAAAYAAARTGKREHPNAQDAVAGDAVLIRLLWLVEGSEGGFLGLADSQLADRVRCLGARFTIQAATAAMYAPGNWPTPNTIERKAA